MAMKQSHRCRLTKALEDTRRCSRSWGRRRCVDLFVHKNGAQRQRHRRSIFSQRRPTLPAMSASSSSKTLMLSTERRRQDGSAESAGECESLAYICQLTCQIERMKRSLHDVPSFLGKSRHNECTYHGKRRHLVLSSDYILMLCHSSAFIMTCSLNDASKTKLTHQRSRNLAVGSQRTSVQRPSKLLSDARI
jgi:hypothetical protein